MPPGMYSTTHLLEIIRLSAFKSPLFYPSSAVLLTTSYVCFLGDETSGCDGGDPGAVLRIRDVYPGS
jgi:hypothetical protein